MWLHSRDTGSDPRQIDVVAAFNFYDELQKVAAIDVEVSVKSAFRLGMSTAVVDG
jgi:hypothetical protein